MSGAATGGNTADVWSYTAASSPTAVAYNISTRNFQLNLYDAGAAVTTASAVQFVAGVSAAIYLAQNGNGTAAAALYYIIPTADEITADGKLRAYVQIPCTTAPT